jgi:AraC-like DNA-binding protein
MEYELINIMDDLPIGIEARNIRHCSVHRHEGVLEIVFVLKGKVDMDISFDRISLQAGDFAFVNQHDFHNMDGKDSDNIAVSVYLDLKYFSKYFKNIEYITFITEDEQNDRKQTKEAFLVRNQIVEIINELNQKHEGYKFRVNQFAFKLVETMVNQFNEIIFYNDSIKMDSVKIDRYYLIMKYILENSKGKDILDNISSNEYFCKSYLYHLFKDVVTFSFQDIVSMIRNSKSEELLLNTKMSISEISIECGFSDPKYYYKHFKKWYHCTPAEFRQKYQKELCQEDDVIDLKISDIVSMANSFLDSSVVDDKLDPLSQMKVFGGGTQGREENDGFGLIPLGQNMVLPSPDGSRDTPEWESFTDHIRSVVQSGLKPCVRIDYNSKSFGAWDEMIGYLIGYSKEIEMTDFEVWICYNNVELIEEVRTFKAELKRSYPTIEFKAFVTL